VHKRRNVLKQLPKSEHRWVARALEQAWRHQDADEANTYLDELIKELEPKWPAAAASLREGLAQTLTCQRLGLPPELLRALGSTNLIENVFSTAGHCAAGSAAGVVGRRRSVGRRWHWCRRRRASAGRRARKR